MYQFSLQVLHQMGNISLKKVASLSETCPWTHLIVFMPMLSHRSASRGPVCRDYKGRVLYYCRKCNIEAPPLFCHVSCILWSSLCFAFHPKSSKPTGLSSLTFFFYPTQTVKSSYHVKVVYSCAQVLTVVMEGTGSDAAQPENPETEKDFP